MITESNLSERPGTQERYSWIDLRRKIEQVREEKRKTPRIELHCPVAIEGFQGENTVTDISLGGVFIECENSLRRRFQVGQTLRLFVKLPTEDGLMTIRVQVANVRDRGIGCKFVEITQRTKEAIEHCFNVFKGTLLLR